MRTFGQWRRPAQVDGFWGFAIKLALLLLSGVILLLVAFTAFFVVLPLALAGGLALHFFIRRKLRQAQRRAASEDLVIDGEYTVIDSPRGGSARVSPHPRQ